MWIESDQPSHWIFPKNLHSAHFPNKSSTTYLLNLNSNKN